MTFSSKFGLDSIAKQGAIDIIFTLDDANLTSKLPFVMVGLKLVDIAVKYLLTGAYKFNPDDTATYLPLGRNWCFSFSFCMGMETKCIYQEEFSEIFHIFVHVDKEGQKSPLGWALSNFTNHIDMATIQKNVRRRLAAKM